MSGISEHETFLKLSQVLTGEQRLSLALAEEYYDRILRAYPEQLAELLTKFDSLSSSGDQPCDDDQLCDEIRNNIMVVVELAKVAREIIMLWYMSGFRSPDENCGEQELGPETPEQYFQGLLWPTIRAHPLGLSGGYFGYWHYPPEN